MLLQTIVLERGDAIYVPPNVVYQVCNLPERFYSISKQKFLFQYSGTNATRILSVPVLSLIWATEWIEILFSSDVKVFYILQHTKFISNFYDHFSAYSSTPCWTMKLCEKLRRFGNAWKSPIQTSPLTWTMPFLLGKSFCWSIRASNMYVLHRKKFNERCLEISVLFLLIYRERQRRRTGSECLQKSWEKFQTLYQNISGTRTSAENLSNVVSIRESITTQFPGLGACILETQLLPFQRISFFILTFE